MGRVRAQASARTTTRHSTARGRTRQTSTPAVGADNAPRDQPPACSADPTSTAPTGATTTATDAEPQPLFLPLLSSSDESARDSCDGRVGRPLGPTTTRSTTTTTAEPPEIEEIKPEPTPELMASGVQTFHSIPTRDERAKIHHQRKPRPGDYHVKRSRKRRYQRMCAPVRDSKHVYHAHTLRAQYIKCFLTLLCVLDLFAELHRWRPIFHEPPPPPTKDLEPVGIDEPCSKPTVWPDDVIRIHANVNPDGVAFKDEGDLGDCGCVGDCFRDTCQNAGAALYCTPDNCSLRAVCSNAVREQPGLRLYTTEDQGIGLFTTVPLEVGDTVGEYAGILRAMEGAPANMRPVELKHNTGYTMILNKRASDGRFVYIEAKDAGAMTRFANHCCEPVAEFVELCYRDEVKVVVIMRKAVRAGAEITVDYGKSVWFTCHCWKCEAVRAGLY